MVPLLLEGSPPLEGFEDADDVRVVQALEDVDLQTRRRFIAATAYQNHDLCRPFQGAF